MSRASDRLFAPASALHPGDIEQVVDHAQQGMAPLERHLQKLLLVRVQIAQSLDGLQTGEERGERRAQVVDDHAGEAVAQFLQLLKLPVSLPQLVPQALLLQAGPDTGFEQRLVDGPGRITLSISLRAEIITTGIACKSVSVFICSRTA